MKRTRWKALFVVGAVALGLFLQSVPSVEATHIVLDQERVTRSLSLAAGPEGLSLALARAAGFGDEDIDGLETLTATLVNGTGFSTATASAETDGEKFKGKSTTLAFSPIAVAGGKAKQYSSVIGGIFFKGETLAGAGAIGFLDGPIYQPDDINGNGPLEGIGSIGLSLNRSWLEVAFQLDRAYYFDIHGKLKFAHGTLGLAAARSAAGLFLGSVNSPVTPILSLQASALTYGTDLNFGSAYFSISGLLDPGTYILKTWVATQALALGGAPLNGPTGPFQINGENGVEFPLIGGLALAKTTSRLSVDFQPTPEPSTLFLLGTGLVGMVGYMRLRRKAN